MALTVTLRDPAVPAGGTVRGTVHGLDAFPDARRLTLAVVHDARHQKEHGRVETERDPRSGRAGSVDFELTVSADAEPTFHGQHFRSLWRVEARVDLPGRRDETGSADLVVTAAPAMAPPEDPVRAAARGTARFLRFAGIFLVLDLAALAALYLVLGSVPTAIAIAFVAPAAVTLLALVLVALRPGPVERLELSAPRERWRLGDEVPLRVEVEGQPDGFHAVEVALRGEEVWVQSTGKTAHTRRATFHEEKRRLEGVELTAARASARRWVWDARLRIPATGPTSRAREIEWTARASVEVPRRLDPAVALRLEVRGAVPPG